MGSHRTRWAWVLSGALLLGVQVDNVAGQDCPGTNPNATNVVTYTTAPDFNSEAPPNQQYDDFWVNQPIRNNTVGVEGELRIGSGSAPATPSAFPYIWVACSNRGTVVRIATEPHHSPVHGNVTRGQILGEYYTAPEGAPKDPSRTTVDFDGSVWVGNRANITVDGISMGHIVKIGTGLGYQWIDRNGNGVLDTSTGLGDVRACPDCTGADFTAEDIAFAEDELILLYQPVAAKGLRTVAVDRDNNVWIGGYEEPKWHGLLKGQTGVIGDSHLFFEGLGAWKVVGAGRGRCEQRQAAWAGRLSLAGQSHIRQRNCGGGKIMWTLLDWLPESCYTIGA